MVICHYSTASVFGWLPRGEWDGLIDEVRICDYSLSQDEILQLVCTEPVLGDLMVTGFTY